MIYFQPVLLGKHGIDQVDIHRMILRFILISNKQVA